MSCCALRFSCALLPLVLCLLLCVCYLLYVVVLVFVVWCSVFGIWCLCFVWCVVWQCLLFVAGWSVVCCLANGVYRLVCWLLRVLRRVLFVASLLLFGAYCLWYVVVLLCVGCCVRCSVRWLLFVVCCVVGS